MNRLQRPWEALRLPMLVCRQTNDALISKTDMGLVGEILFARMDALQAAILATRHPAFEAETLLDQVANFSELSSAVVKEIEVRRDGEWGQRLLKDRAAIGAVMDGFMERAAKELAAALPMQKGASDFTRPIARGEARHMALQLRQAGGGQRAISRRRAPSPPSRRRRSRTSVNHLRRYVEDAVREFADATASGARRWNSSSNYCAELAAHLVQRGRSGTDPPQGAAAQSTAA